jgi:ribosomal protein L27
LLQRGSKYKIGKGTYFGKNYTVHAAYDGWVQYFTGYWSRKERKFVTVSNVSPR